MINSLKLWGYYGIALFFLCSTGYSGEAMMPPSPAVKEAAEQTIKACEAKYMTVKALKEKLSKGLDEKMKALKKPAMISLPKAKQEYNTKVEEIALMKKAFDENFNDFSRFTNEKIKIRTAKTNRELKDIIEPYSSNCSRFADGLAGFVDWALTGTGPKGFDTIYRDWLAHAKKGK